MSVPDTSTTASQLGKRETTRFRRLSWVSVVFLAVMGSLWLYATNFSPYSTSTTPSPETTTKSPNDPPQNQVVVRTAAPNNAGLGSVVAQLRSGAAIATVLGANFATFGIPSEHAYKAASILGLDHLAVPLDPGATVCSIASSSNYSRTMELVTSWCENTTAGDAQAHEMREMWRDCGLILDDRPRDVHYEMSRCTWKWVKDVFSKLGLKKRTGGIGLHIRWGDMGRPSYQFGADPLVPERSTPIDTAAQLLRKMRACGMQDELSVYMEWHNDTMLEGLGEPYRIVDTGDNINDLLDLAANRLLILDISSWTILAHQIAEGGITVIPDKDLFDITWHDNGANHVLRWNELLTIPCSDLSNLLTSQKSLQ